MYYTEVNVPVSLLQAAELTPADKLIWMVMQLDKKNRIAEKLDSPARLAARTGLARGTVYHSLARLAAAGWYQAPGPSVTPAGRADRWISLPADLLDCPALKPRDIVIRGLLQQTPLFQNAGGKCTYATVSSKLQCCVKTVRRAMQALQKACWLATRQTNQLAPIYYRLDNPRAAYCRDLLAQTRERLNHVSYTGEAIARAMVTFLAEPAGPMVDLLNGAGRRYQNKVHQYEAARAPQAQTQQAHAQLAAG